MVTRSGYKSRALSFVLALVCLCWAAAAFAQSATGTISGTVVDGTGAALPGATVNVTEAATGTVRTVITDDAGLFRFAALNPGRYSLAVELASFRTLNVADIALLSTEVRDLGKLGLQIGGVTETVTITLGGHARAGGGQLETVARSPWTTSPRSRPRDATFSAC